MIKQYVLGALACGLLAAFPAQGASIARSGLMTVEDADTGPAADSDPSLCLDSMETVPDGDDLVPTPTAMDGGCSVPATPIST